MLGKPQKKSDHYEGGRTKKKKIQKKEDDPALNSRGGELRALVVGPLRKNFFYGFPYPQMNCVHR